MVRCRFFDVILFMIFTAGITGQYENCTGDLDTINDGNCDNGNNIAACGFDGGDCCECSCTNDRLYPCGIGGFNCLDPDAVGGSGDCQNATAFVSTCSMDSLQAWSINDTTSATSFAEAVNCSGGKFEAKWRGKISIDHTIEVPEGTTVSLTGEGSGAEVNGGGKTRLFTAIGATLHINNLVLSNGNTTYGGAIAAVRSAVFLNQTSCSGNIASSYGGAVYVGRSSTLIWDGQAILTDNHAGRGGGAVVVSMNSTAYWNGSTEFAANAITGDEGSGGAVYIRDHSRVSWDGVTSFINNTVRWYGGALHIADNSAASWDGETSFANNVASLMGGAIYVYLSSRVSWDGETSFINNTADDGGALNIYGNSNVSWTANTSFITNTANDGGALSIYDNSMASWIGLTLFVENTAYHGGALFAYKANVSWGGLTVFLNNIADSHGGALYVRLSSTVSWDGVTSFDANTAQNGGAIYAVFDSVVSWDGLTSFDDNSADVGGALFIESDSFVSWTAETTFSNNAADYGGALVVGSESFASWTGETSFVKNHANTSGGAIYSNVGSNISAGGDTYFHENHAGLDGGAIYADISDDETIALYAGFDSGTVVRFHGNTCGANGGAIAVIGAVSIGFSANMTFSRNVADVAGGAVYISGVSLGPRFENTRFILNSAEVGGGVYATGSGTSVTNGDNPTTFIGCDFIGNEAVQAGGALDSGAGIDLIENTSFVRNTAAIGGALRLVGTISLYGCEFIENLSDEDEGSGISNDGVMEVSYCTFVDNVYNCRSGSYLEYNKTDARFETVCKGCEECNGCEVEGREPMCLEELEHSTAEGGDATVEFLLIDPGYWRATTTSIEILECYNAKACLGGVTGRSGYCKKGHEGPYCSVCSAGYTASLGYACTKCSDSIDRGIALTSVGAIVFLFAFIAFISYMLSAKSGNADRGIVARLTRFIPLQSVKIVIVVWQIVTQFSSVANVVFPSVYQELLDGVDILNFDLTWVISAGCFIDTDFHDQLLFATLGPLVGMAILGITYVTAMRRSRASEVARRIIRRKHVSMVLLLTFLVYSPVSSTLFKTFACEDLDDGKLYLLADYRIECNSSKHTALEIYASFMVFLYVVGIPAFYGVILYSNREALTKHTGREEEEAIKPITDLWGPYRPDRFYYEVIECMRRVLLTGALVFIYPNTSAQIAVALMMATFFMVVGEALAPHASSWDTWCSRTGHAIVFTTIFLALLLKVDVSGESVRSQNVFESVLIAAHSCLILIVVVEAVAMLVAWRQEVREDTEPRVRPCLDFSSPVVGKGGTRPEEDEAPPFLKKTAGNFFGGTDKGRQDQWLRDSVGVPKLMDRRHRCVI